MLVIGIAGGAGSGKTTVVRKILQSIDPQDVAVLSQDAYYRDSSDIPLQERQRINVDHPDSIEFDLLARHVAALKRGEAVEEPTYSYTTYQRGEETVHVEPRPVILVEGILVLQNEALRKLPVLVASTDMLVCGEDLGMIPACVPEVMKQLQILSLEIPRMPKEWNCEFGDVSRYPVRSVCTTSTHDMSGIRGWWQEDPARTQRYFNEVLGEPGQAPATCEPWICERMVELTLSAPSMLAILPLQDWLSIDGRLRRKNPDEERINNPACPHYYWRYRMHLSLEQLLAEGVFNTRLQEMIARSGR